MTQTTAQDRDGRRWTFLTIDGTLRARLVAGDCTPAVLDLQDLIDTYGPLLLSPSRPAAAICGNYAALVDTVDLVASDPESASVEQIAVISEFARSIVLPDRTRA